MSAISVLERALEEAITASGLSPIEVRKRLSDGEVVRVVYDGRDYHIKVAEGKAVLTTDTSILLERHFVPWDEFDDQYKEMMEKWGRDGESSEELFSQASHNYRSRFKMDRA